MWQLPQLQLLPLLEQLTVFRLLGRHNSDVLELQLMPQLWLVLQLVSSCQSTLNYTFAVGVEGPPRNG